MAKKSKKICELCGKRAAKFCVRRHNGALVWKADKDHRLCSQCFRSEKDKHNINRKKWNKQLHLLNPHVRVSHEPRRDK